MLETLQTYKDSYELENNSFLLCATFLNPNYKSFQFFEKYEKKKYLKSVKEFLSDFYLAKRVSEIIPIKKVINQKNLSCHLMMKKMIPEVIVTKM